jgi:hypothetical protein
MADSDRLLELVGGDLSRIGKLHNDAGDFPIPKRDKGNLPRLRDSLSLFRLPAVVEQAVKRCIESDSEDELFHDLRSSFETGGKPVVLKEFLARKPVDNSVYRFLGTGVFSLYVQTSRALQQIIKGFSVSFQGFTTS